MSRTLNLTNFELNNLYFDKHNMSDSINDYTLRPFSKDQKFLIRLICESYDEKLEHKNEEIAELQALNLTLQNQNNELQNRVTLLRKINKTLADKQRESTNMIRILSNYMDDGMNVLLDDDLNDMIKEKLNVLNKSKLNWPK